MKEMIYENSRKSAELLSEGEFLGYNFCVVSYGTHPCAYVQIPDTSKYYMVDYDNIPIDCHGDLTYSGRKSADNGWLIGWDYAHYGDHIGLFDSGGKRWTTQEMVEECKDVIEQLIELEARVGELLE